MQRLEVSGAVQPL